MKRIILISSAVVLFSCIVFLLPYTKFVRETLSISIYKLFLPYSSDLRTVNNSVSMLLLGIPGGRREGPTLSDAIIAVKYDLSANHVMVISVPRDIWSDALRDKINSAYAYGKEKKATGGIALAKAETSTIVGFPIQYGAVLNFDQFKDLIDTLGGINVTVVNRFTDHDYPIEGKENDQCNGDPSYRCRYKTVSFVAGTRHMNGTEALEFVRSRHAIGEEGNDFARGKRQELMLRSVASAIVNKFLTLDLDSIKNTYKALDKSIERDITNQEVAELILNVVRHGKPAVSIISFPQDLFTVPDYSLYEGKYVLIPASGHYADIHSYIKKEMQQKETAKKPQKE